MSLILYDKNNALLPEMLIKEYGNYNRFQMFIFFVYLVSYIIQQILGQY